MANLYPIVFQQADLRQFSEGIFQEIGLNESDAQLASDVLISADLAGVDSHGISRLNGYVELWKAGRINPTPKIRVVRDKKTILNIDGDGGLGLVVAPKAMEILNERTSEYGSAWASVQNSNHFGIAGYHAKLALSKGFIGVAMTNATPFVSPTRSKQKMLGTNPVAYAIPTKDGIPIVIDLATSAVARGKLELAKRAEKPIPHGWLQTKEGRDTDDPDDILDGGALLPLGSSESNGSHKGYALSSLVDIFSGVLSGANYGPWVPPFVSFLPLRKDMPGKGLGHFLGAMDISGFDEQEEVLGRIQHWKDTFKEAERIEVDRPVMIPGEPEHFTAEERTRSGIPLNPKVVSVLEKLSKEYGVELSSK
jgi:LDH2 family malate/lactate/ureidoglycolate dehydrogenase